MIDNYQRADRIAAAVLAALMALGFFFAFVLPLGAQEGCTITRAWEDGSAYAVCPDGSEWVYDPDGQPFHNTAGVPVREPGWYRVEDVR